MRLLSVFRRAFERYLPIKIFYFYAPHGGMTQIKDADQISPIIAQPARAAHCGLDSLGAADLGRLLDSQSCPMLGTFIRVEPVDSIRAPSPGFTSNSSVY